MSRLLAKVAAVMSAIASFFREARCTHAGYFEAT